MLEIDRNLVGCVALHLYPELSVAELACLYVHKNHEGQGYGRKLMAYAEQLAAEKGVKQVLALSTQAFNYFQQKGGYTEVTPDILPPERRKKYDASARNSKVMIKPVSPKLPGASLTRIFLASFSENAPAGGVPLCTIPGSSTVSSSLPTSPWLFRSGVYKGRGERSMEGFAVGDRNIPWWAVLASIMAAEVSAGTFLGTPGEGYGLRNFTYGQLAIGTVLARIIVAYVFIGRFYELRVVSIYEFLETRFGRSTKLASSFVFLITRALASGSRMFVPAILLVVAWQMIRDVHPNFNRNAAPLRGRGRCSWS